MVNVNLPSIEDVWDMVFLSICSRLATHPSFLLIFTERRIWERLGCSRWKFFSVLHTFSIDRCFGDLYCLTRVSKSLKAINHSTCFRKFVQLFRTCSLKLTTRPWKMVFEKRSLFFWVSVYFQDWTVRGRDITNKSCSILSWDLHGCVTPATVRKKGLKKTYSYKVGPY